MVTFHFTKQAEKEWGKLDENIRTMLQSKLVELKDESLLDQHIKVVVDLLPATHRIRIGNYRLLIGKESDKVIIYSLGHRRDIYR